MSGCNLTCTSLCLLLTRWVLSPWAGLSLRLCVSLCVLISWLQLVLRQYLFWSMVVYSLYLCMCAHIWKPLPVVDYSVHYLSCVHLPCLCVHSGVWMWMCPSTAKLCVCVWELMHDLSPCRQRDESKAWISLKGTEPVERSVAKFSD